MSVKGSDVVATVSARACVCAVSGGGGGAIIQKKSLLFVRCHQHCSNKWQYLHTVYLFCERAKSLRWSVMYTCTVPSSHNETSICMFLEYTFGDILTTVHTSESEISTGWSQEILLFLRMPQQGRFWIFQIKLIIILGVLKAISIIENLNIKCTLTDSPQSFFSILFIKLYVKITKPVGSIRSQ